MNDHHTAVAPTQSAPAVQKRRCPGCGEEVTLIEIDPGVDLRGRRVVSFLTNLFKPPGVKPSARYRCPRCAHEFTEARPADIFVVPLVLVALMVLAVIAFLVLVNLAVRR
ncbi:hypothetical protein GX586_08195 [bacterium]|nr:hypothetical protein [bacterium]